MKVLVLLSGGMDSTVLLHKMHNEQTVIGALSFDYGAKHNHREIPFAKYHAGLLDVPHEVIELGFMAKKFSSSLLKTGGDIPEGHYEDESMKQTVVPFRNGIMLSIAAGYAESIGVEAVAIAAHSGDHAIYPDCRESFMQSIEDAIEDGTYAGIRLLRPFVKVRKEDIATEGAQLGVDYSQTWSCYKGEEIHCGKCGTCVERKEAFSIAKLKDPTAYQVI